MELEPGHSLGRYKIEARLGKGGFGSVYAAYDTLLQRRVALKVLSAIGDERARLVAEARAAARLVHPNVVTVHEVESEGDVTYLVMELVPGVTLRKRAAAATVPQKIEWLAQIADALAAAHAAGLVHRDVKPDNVVIGETTGTVKVLDFGIAKAFDPPPTLAGGGPFSGIGAPPPTATGKVVGTLRYMAPEQLLGHPVGPPVDQWAWGVLAYEVLTGQHPGVVSGASTPEEWILLGHTRPVDEVLPGIPPHVAAAIGRALARDPWARFANMAEVAAALRAPAAPPVSTGNATPVFHASQPTAPTAIVQHAAVAPSFSSGPVAPMPSTQSGGIQGPLPPVQPPLPAYVAAPGPFPASHTMPAAVHAPPRRGVPGWAIGLGVALLLLAVLGAGTAVLVGLAHVNAESTATTADAGALPRSTTTSTASTASPSLTAAVDPTPKGLGSSAAKGGPPPPPGTSNASRVDAGSGAPSPPGTVVAGAPCKDDCDCPQGVCSGAEGGTCIPCPPGQFGAHAGSQLGAQAGGLGPGACGPSCASSSSADCPADRVCRNFIGISCARPSACVPPTPSELARHSEEKKLWDELHARYPSWDAYRADVSWVAKTGPTCPADTYDLRDQPKFCARKCRSESECKRGSACTLSLKTPSCAPTINSWEWDKAPRLK